MGESEVGVTDTNRVKKAMEWFYSTVFQDEAIRFSPRERSAPLPSPLRAARSLAVGASADWQSRESVFVKQAKLLANYEDDYAYDRPVLHYFPTYQSLTDEELRGYFSWRTKLRGGNVQKTSLSFAFLYIYELLNQVGVSDPADGYQKLLSFRTAYGALDKGILSYLDRWLFDYVVYYALDPSLLSDTPIVRTDNAIFVLATIENHDTSQVMDAVTTLSGRYLERSKFYAQYQEDMQAVLVRVLRKIAKHYESRCIKSMTEQYFGSCCEHPVTLFDSAVFLRHDRARVCQFDVDAVRSYRCANGLWYLRAYHAVSCPNSKLSALVKTVDSVMRECYAYKNPVKRELDTKWQLRIIEEEANAYLNGKRAAQPKKFVLDVSRLEAIRRDAAATQDKLIVEEELEDAAPPSPPLTDEPPAETPLSREEYRLLQCLLYGRDFSWVRTSGLMLSVLVDGINEKLFDEFGDSVLEMDDQPEPVADYIPDLKERIHP